jgi:integrase
MVWAKEKLSDLKIKSAKPSSALRKLSDGKGLQFWVTPRGGRYWRFEYRFVGKRKLLALGTYPDISLREARESADAARKDLREGKDPSDVKRQKKMSASVAAENTFKKVAANLIAKKRREGRSPVTIDKMEWILRKVEASLGNRPIAEITTPEVIRALTKEADAGNLETARRMRTVLGEVFRYGIQHGIATMDPVAATRGALPAPKTRHLSAITSPEQFGALLHLIDDYASRNVVTGSALQLMALLYSRPGELRKAIWTEFDLEKGIWEIPASRMKLRQAHTKPLSRQAIAILKRLSVATGPVGRVFPAVGRPANPLSENTMNAALKRMGIAGSEHSAHGFRATASTLLNASNLFSSDAIEHSLAHKDTDAVRRAYARGDAMAERRKMAQWWADYLDQLRSGKSVKVDSMLEAGN